MFDIDNTFTFGAEIPFQKQYSFQQELGWGNANTNAWDSERSRYPDKTNWRLRTQVRYYFHETKKHSGRFYWGAEYFRKDIFINQVKSIGQQCNPNTGVCAYFEEMNVQTHRAINGLHIKIGFQVKNRDNLVFDFFTGFGLRNIKVSNNAPTGGINNQLDRIFIGFNSLVPDNYTTPSIALGFSVGYEIKKKVRF